MPDKTARTFAISVAEMGDREVIAARWLAEARAVNLEREAIEWRRLADRLASVTVDRDTLYDELAAELGWDPQQ